MKAMSKHDIKKGDRTLRDKEKKERQCWHCDGWGGRLRSKFWEAEDWQECVYCKGTGRLYE
jgi:DnaJ-class molecular chaperone